MVLRTIPFTKKDWGLKGDEFRNRIIVTMDGGGGEVDDVGGKGCSMLIVR